MLEVETTGQHSQMAMRSGQKLLESEKLNVIKIL